MTLAREFPHADWLLRIADELERVDPTNLTLEELRIARADWFLRNRTEHRPADPPDLAAMREWAERHNPELADWLENGA